MNGVMAFHQQICEEKEESVKWAPNATYSPKVQGSAKRLIPGCVNAASRKKINQTWCLPLRVMHNNF